MGLRISTNIGAMAAARALATSINEQTKSYERLASGKRITTAADDAAGLSISEHLRGQVRSMTQAERNANNAIAFIQVAEGGMTEVANILIRLRELAIQAASDTVGEKERKFIDKEVKELVKEIDRIANSTNFNGVQLLNGEHSGELQFQVGIRASENDRIQFAPEQYNIKADALEIDDLSYESIDDSREALASLDKALATLLEKRASLGTAQNKLHSTINNLQIASENLERARSQIADTDVATETTKLIQRNILQAAGVAVLAQANTAPLQALKLLG